MPNRITLKMLTSDNNESNLPGRFVPGAGAGRGSFQIECTRHGYPRRNILVHALTNWDSDSVLNEYDEQTGRGLFVIVDGCAPDPGSVVELQDTVTPCHDSSLTLTLGAEGIAALQNYLSALEHFRTLSPGDMDSWSRGLENNLREGAQLAKWVVEALQAEMVKHNPTDNAEEKVPVETKPRSTEFERGRTAEHDSLIAELLRRGGYGTLQLNKDPYGIPRMRFVDPDKTHPVDAARLASGILLLKPPS